MESLTDLTLAELLTVTPGEAPDEFVGIPEAYGALGIYGGHFLGQALVAGLATVSEPKLAHSLHCYFLQPGETGDEHQPEMPAAESVEKLIQTSVSGKEFEPPPTVKARTEMVMASEHFIQPTFISGPGMDAVRSMQQCRSRWTGYESRQTL